MDSPWEHRLLERKTDTYSNEDYLKTLVAFANSVHPDEVAVFLIGESDDGTVTGIKNLAGMQEKIRKLAESIYPPIDWRPSIYEQEGQECLRIEIRYNGDTPHFGGPAWIRKGNRTEKAPDEIFQQLIEIRSNPTRELMKWLGREVTLFGDESSVNPRHHRAHNWPLEWALFSPATLSEGNQFWITLRNSAGEVRTIAARNFYLAFDAQNNRLKICVTFS